MMTLIRLTLALLLLATPALAEKIPLAEISRYLNGLTTAEASVSRARYTNATAQRSHCSH